MPPSKSPPKRSEGLLPVAQVHRDGAEFFRKANRLAADPRVKFIFGRAAEEFDKAAKALEPAAKGKGKAKVPALFPSQEFDRIECYVCGYEASAEAIPETCPSCGAARYAFEREIPQDRAWDLVARATKDALAFARKASTSVKDAKGKDALGRATAVVKGLADEAKEERARLERPA